LAGYVPFPRRRAVRAGSGSGLHVHWAELPLPQWILDALEEAFLLLLLADLDARAGRFHPILEITQLHLKLVHLLFVVLALDPFGPAIRGALFFLGHG
jgi:hypothetical protein